MRSDRPLTRQKSDTPGHSESGRSERPSRGQSESRSRASSLQPPTDSLRRRDDDDEDMGDDNEEEDNDDDDARKDAEDAGDDEDVPMDGGDKDDQGTQDPGIADDTKDAEGSDDDEDEGHVDIPPRTQVPGLRPPERLLNPRKKSIIPPDSPPSPGLIHSLSL